jgi:hypothetical protein
VNVLPPDEGKAVSRLLRHCSDLALPAQAQPCAQERPRAQERLELALGAELARRLVGALSGDHRLPARAFRD